MSIPQLDFARKTLTRTQDLPLDSTLWMRLLEQLFRRRGPKVSLPVTRALMLKREKFKSKTSGVKKIGTGDPCKALRHEVSSAMKFVRTADLRIQITVSNDRAHAVIDRTQIASNVTRADRLAILGMRWLSHSNVAGATACARKALTIDPDSIRAALIVAKAIELDPGSADDALILQSELAFARAILQCSAAISRSKEMSICRKFNPHRLERRAARYRGWLRKHFDLLEPVPEGSLSSAQPDAFRQFIQRVVQLAVAKSPREWQTSYDRLRSDPVIIDILEVLIKN